ncbi:hypothetical protein RvY_15800 [Ramazzottius varieornatus]|uniref:Uncharacterized protein n=1 Tax=Ramazzottius varieornatus TaxID=947166 RepID=A0A1D1VW67_RAMVA|nr:hypothetical protein RvY_15800 [Ramazzottius varieornatus]
MQPSSVASSALNSQLQQASLDILCTQLANKIDMLLTRLHKIQAANFGHGETPNDRRNVGKGSPFPSITSLPITRSLFLNRLRLPSLLDDAPREK